MTKGVRFQMTSPEIEESLRQSLLKYIDPDTGLYWKACEKIQRLEHGREVVLGRNLIKFLKGNGYDVTDKTSAKAAWSMFDQYIYYNVDINYKNSDTGDAGV